MKSEKKLKSQRWGELVAAIGVILSLIFVGFEIRQNTAVARGQARQELAALNQDFMSLLSQEDIGRIWYHAWEMEEGLNMEDELSQEESFRARVLMTITLRRFENVFFQFSEGLINESALGNYGLQRIWTYKSARFSEFWAAARTGYDPDFVKYFESRLGLSVPPE